MHRVHVSGCEEHGGHEDGQNESVPSNQSLANKAAEEQLLAQAGQDGGAEHDQHKAETALSQEQVAQLFKVGGWLC